MFLRDDQGMELAGAGGRGSGRAFGRQLVPLAERGALDRARVALARTDWVPDLGQDIGSRTWWRGLATCAGLCAIAWVLAPGLHPLPGAVPAPLAGEEREDARAQGIAPLGLGANTGRRMAATDLVVPLTQAPERPRVELSAREREVLGLVGEGLDDPAIAERLGVSRNTVRNHVSRLYAKIGVNRRSTAVIWAREHGH